MMIEGRQSRFIEIISRGFRQISSKWGIPNESVLCYDMSVESGESCENKQTSDS